MTAYLIANIEIKDPHGYEAYASRTRAIIERHKGRFIVRGGAVHSLEGASDVHRLVIIEFPDMATARGFYDSADYQAIIDLRTSSSDAWLFIVEGLENEPTTTLRAADTKLCKL